MGKSTLCTVLGTMGCMTHAQTIKQARVDRGLSQQALADRIGTSRSRISSYEAEKSSPTLATLTRIADHLEFSVETPRRASGSEVFVPSPRRLAASQVAAEWSRYQASRSAAAILEAEGSAEGWDIDFYQAGKIIEGRTVDGGLGVDKARRTWKVMRSLMKTPPDLRWSSGDVLIEPSRQWSHPYRAMWFMATAIIHGADPATSRMISSAHLCHHGYPWLHVPYGRHEDYEAAMSALLNGNSTQMVGLLEDSIPFDWKGQG